MNDSDMRLGGEAVAQEGDEPVVQLDGHDAAGLLRDQLGEHARAGADLQDGVLRGEIGRGHDMRAMRGVNEEVLAQPLIRVNAQGRKLSQRALLRSHAQCSPGMCRSHSRTTLSNSGTSIVAVSNTTRTSTSK